MRRDVPCLVLCLTLCGCTSPPDAPPRATTPVIEQEVFPTPTQLASWKVSMDDAIRIACEQLGGEPRAHFKLEASPLVRGSEQYWSVSASGYIAGGWDADVDAFTGRVLRSRRLPGR